MAVAPLQVNNSGSLPFTYGMATTAAGDTALAGALKVTVAVAATTCTQAGGLVGGTIIVDGVTGLNNATIAATRALTAGTNEILCFKVELPRHPGEQRTGHPGQDNHRDLQVHGHAVLTGLPGAFTFW